MNKKKVITWILATCLSLSFLTACSSSGEETESKTTASAAGETQSTAQESKTDAEKGEVDAEESGTYDFSDKEHYTLKVMMFGDAATQDCEEIAARLSEITEEKLNANVEIVRVGFGSYEQQLNLALSSGEELDLFSPFTLGMSSLEVGS